MIHLLSTAAWGGYNTSPTFTLPAGFKRMVVFIGTGTGSGGMTAATYNGVNMTILTNSGWDGASNRSVAIAYLEIPDTWAAGSYALTKTFAGSFMPVCFGGVKRTTGYIGTDTDDGSGKVGFSRSIEARPSGLVLTAVNAVDKTITVSNMTAFYSTAGTWVGYATPSASAFVPAVSFASSYAVYRAASFRPKPNMGAVVIV